MPSSGREGKKKEKERRKRIDLRDETLRENPPWEEGQDVGGSRRGQEEAGAWGSEGIGRKR